MLTKRSLKTPSHLPGRRTNTEAGQGLAEVAIILTLVVVVAILALTDLGQAIVQTLETVANTI